MEMAIASFLSFLAGYLLCSYKHHRLQEHERLTRLESLSSSSFPVVDHTQRDTKARFPQDHP